MVAKVPGEMYLIRRPGDTEVLYFLLFHLHNFNLTRHTRGRDEVSMCSSDLSHSSLLEGWRSIGRALSVTKEELDVENLDTKNEVRSLGAVYASWERENSILISG